MKLPILLLFQSNAQTTVENIWDLLSDKQFSRNEIQHIIIIGHAISQRSNHRVKAQDCISRDDSKGEKYNGETNTAGGLPCMKWRDVWSRNWNSRLTKPVEGLNHNLCRNIIGSQFPQPWCMVKKPGEGPTAVQCSIPKCDQIQPPVDIFPTNWPQIIESTTTGAGSDYGSTPQYGSHTVHIHSTQPPRSEPWFVESSTTTSTRSNDFGSTQAFDSRTYVDSTVTSTVYSTIAMTATPEITCANTPTMCHHLAKCVEQNGSSQCVCKDGFEGDGLTNGVGCSDFDECRTGEHTCDQNAACINKHGDFDCKCKRGFRGDGFNCGNINECVDPSKAWQRRCGRRRACKDTFGSFKCITCRKGTVLRNGKCHDINECYKRTHTCRGNTKCENNYGGFTCVQCPSGMKPNAARTKCVDIDECKSDICHPNASCENTPGSYKCECNDGFTGDGNWCQDINECITGKF